MVEVRVELYLCNDCSFYFKRNEAEGRSISNGFEDVSYDVCPNCGSDNITLHNFGLRRVI